MIDKNLPILDKVRLDDGTEYWVLEVDHAPSIRFESADRTAANAAWTSATWAYHNGRADIQREIKTALGFANEDSKP